MLICTSLEIIIKGLKEPDLIDFAKAVVEPGRKVIVDYKTFENHFAKQL